MQYVPGVQCNLLEVELDSHVDGADNILELGDEEAVNTEFDTSFVL